MYAYRNSVVPKITLSTQDDDEDEAGALQTAYEQRADLHEIVLTPNHQTPLPGAIQGPSPVTIKMSFEEVSNEMQRLNSTISVYASDKKKMEQYIKELEFTLEDEQYAKKSVVENLVLESVRVEELEIENAELKMSMQALLHDQEQMRQQHEAAITLLRTEMTALEQDLIQQRLKVAQTSTDLEVFRKFAKDISARRQGAVSVCPKCNGVYSSPQAGTPRTHYKQVQHEEGSSSRQNDLLYTSPTPATPAPESSWQRAESSTALAAKQERPVIPPLSFSASRIRTESEESRMYSKALDTPRGRSVHSPALSPIQAPVISTSNSTPSPQPINGAVTAYGETPFRHVQPVDPEYEHQTSPKKKKYYRAESAPVACETHSVGATAQDHNIILNFVQVPDIAANYARISANPAFQHPRPAAPRVIDTAEVPGFTEVQAARPLVRTRSASSSNLTQPLLVSPLTSPRSPDPLHWSRPAKLNRAVNSPKNRIDILLVGSSGAGKTALMNLALTGGGICTSSKVCNNGSSGTHADIKNSYKQSRMRSRAQTDVTDLKTAAHDSGHHPTVGVELYTLRFENGSQSKMIRILDSAGQVRYRSFARRYFSKVKCIFIVYDVTDRGSYENCLEWLEEIHNTDLDGSGADSAMTAPDPPFLVLVGNTLFTSQIKPSVVPFNEASALAASHGAACVEGDALLDVIQFIHDLTEHPRKPPFQQESPLRSVTDNSKSNSEPASSPILLNRMLSNGTFLRSHSCSPQTPVPLLPSAVDTSSEVRSPNSIKSSKTSATQRVSYTPMFIQGDSNIESPSCSLSGKLYDPVQSIKSGLSNRRVSLRAPLSLTFSYPEVASVCRISLPCSPNKPSVSTLRFAFIAKLGLVLACGVDDGRIQMYQLLTHAELVPQPNALSSIEEEPDSTRMHRTTSLSDLFEDVNFTDSVHHRLVYELAEHSSTITTLSWSASDSTLMLTSSHDHSCCLWSVTAMMATVLKIVKDECPVICVSFIPSKPDCIVRANQKGYLHLVDMTNGNSLFKVNLGSRPSCLSSDPLGERFFVGFDNGSLRCFKCLDNSFQLQSRVQIATAKGSSVTSVSYISEIDQDGDALLVNATDNAVYVFDCPRDASSTTSLGTGRRYPIAHSKNQVSSAYFKRAGLIVSGSETSSVHLLNVEDATMQPLLLRGHSAPVHHVTLSADEAFLASADASGLVILWSIHN
eukprot:GILJ01009617.1.p1 GENE.GILJ01009617.1~~GILJ01009617.1.p1  ORF type:complete len:1202 (-),score=160.29 GILJ01009617.1:330-3935(-)